MSRYMFMAGAIALLSFVVGRYRRAVDYPLEGYFQSCVTRYPGPNITPLIARQDRAHGRLTQAADVRLAEVGC